MKKLWNLKKNLKKYFNLGYWPLWYLFSFLKESATLLALLVKMIFLENFFEEIIVRLIKDYFKDSGFKLFKNLFSLTNQNFKEKTKKKESKNHLRKLTALFKKPLSFLCYLGPRLQDFIAQVKKLKDFQLKQPNFYLFKANAKKDFCFILNLKKFFTSNYLTSRLAKNQKNYFRDFYFNCLHFLLPKLKSLKKLKKIKNFAKENANNFYFLSSGLNFWKKYFTLISHFPLNLIFFNFYCC